MCPTEKSCCAAFSAYILNHMRESGVAEMWVFQDNDVIAFFSSFFLLSPVCLCHFLPLGPHALLVCELVWMCVL